MNILQMEDMVKGMPDEILMREAQMPSGQIPQFLSLSEIQRRKEMRDKLQAPPQATVADQILQGGIAAAMPQQPPQGGMGAPQGPPMGPPPGPEGAPVMAYGGGQMPYRMQGGGSVPPGGGNPQVFKQFMQRNFGTPQGLATNIGMVGGALLGGPLGSVAGANIGSYLGSRMSNPVQMSDWDRMRLFSTPFSQAAQQQAVPVEPPPFVDGMYSGGQIPGTVYMQQGQTVPRTSRAQRVNQLRDQIQAAILQGAPKEQVDVLRSQLEILTAPAPLTPQAQDYQTFQRIREAGVFPQLTTPALEMAAPDFSAQLNAAMQPPAAPDVAAPNAAPAMAPTADTMQALPATDMASMFNQFRANIGTGGGMPRNLGQAIQPFEQYFAIDQNAPALQATDFSPLIQQAEKRGAERAASYAETIKGIENEMKRERLGAVLTTLGANLMAGEGALGLEKAGALAQQMGKETRQEIAAERRAARSAEEATSDRIFALNAQQLTADKEAQRAIFNAQQNVKEKAFTAFSSQMKDERQAAQAASQLAATLTVGAVNSMRDKIVTEGANARAVLDFAKEQARSLKDTLGTSTVGMAAADIQKLVEETLISGIITGYKAIGQAPPKGFESQMRAAASAGGTAGTAAQSGSSRFNVQVVNPGQ
jgi:hypothetical protein